MTIVIIRPVPLCPEQKGAHNEPIFPRSKQQAAGGDRQGHRCLRRQLKHRPYEYQFQGDPERLGFHQPGALQFFGQGKHSNRHLRQRTGQRFFCGVAWRRGGLRPFGDKPYRHRDQAGPVESSGGGSFRQTGKEYTTCNASCSGRQKI